SREAVSTVVRADSRRRRTTRHAAPRIRLAAAASRNSASTQSLVTSGARSRVRLISTALARSCHSSLLEAKAMSAHVSRNTALPSFSLTRILLRRAPGVVIVLLSHALHASIDSLRRELVRRIPRAIATDRLDPDAGPLGQTHPGVCHNLSVLDVSE